MNIGTMNKIINMLRNNENHLYQIDDQTDAKLRLPLKYKPGEEYLSEHARTD